MFNLIRKCVAWLRQFAQTQNKVNPMTDVTVPAPVAVPVVAESVLANLKDILKTVGHDVEAVWEEAVALAKKVA
jgi:hypothetical protein